MAGSLYDRDAAALKWLKRLLVVLSSVVAVALLASYWLLSTESGANWLLARAQSASGDALHINSVRGSLRSGIHLSDVSFSSDGIDVAVDSVGIEAAFGLFPLHLKLPNVRLDSGSIHLRSAEPSADDVPPLNTRQLLDSLVLPLRVSVDALQLRNIELLRDKRSLASVDALSLRASWYESLQVQALDLQSDKLTATGSASVDFDDQQTARLAVIVSGYGFEEHAIELVGVARDNGYEFSHLAIDGDLAELAGSALVDWKSAIELDADVSITRFDLHRFVSSWPAANPISGEIAFAFGGELVSVSHAQISVANSAAAVAGEGSIDLSTAALRGSLQWSDMQWPIDTAVPNIESKSAVVNVAGSLDQWTVDGDIDIATPSTPQGAFSIDANGDREHAEVSILSGAIIGGDISGDLAYRWVDEQPWSANLSVRQVAVGELLQEWPGTVSGKIVASGFTDKQQATIELSGVNGELRGKPLLASGGLSLAPGMIIANKFEVTYGTSSARLSGAPGTSAGLTYDVRVDSLAEILDDADGAFHARGNYRDAEKEMHMAIDLDSERLAFGEVILEDVSVRNAGDVDALLHADIVVGKLSLAGQEIEALNATTKISSLAQDFDLAFQIRGAETQFSLAGALDDWDRGLDSVWRGELTSLSIDATEQHRLDLDSAAELVVSRDNAAIQTACLSGTLGSRFCGSGEWRSGGYSVGDLQLIDLPLSLANQFIATGLQLDQYLSGDLEWSLPAQGDLSANGSLSLTAGRLQSLRSEKLSILTGPGTAEFDISDGELLSGSLNLPLPGNGEIVGDFAIADVATAAQSDISGKLHVAISDISMLSHFSSLMDTATGNLQADLTLGGKVSAPKVVGDIRLMGGELEYLPIGLDLSDINLQAEMSADQNTNLYGTFRAGDGTGEIESAASYQADDALALEFSIKGERLTLIDVPDLRAVVDTDLDVAYTPNELKLGGEITVGEARVRPTNLVNSGVSASEDVVIVAGELPEAEIEKPQDEVMKIFGELNVTLGSDVTLDVSVARATASGSADFKWTGEQMPTATGRYDLRGQVQAYGQVLDITEGRVRYSDGPADNPYLRIRAEREIFGNTQVKKAGVFIDGNAQGPRVETYTTPLTTEERALTLLATGSDFDFEQGVGAVDFGTYIAPRLFVAYGVSLFGRDNVISARYDLSKGFGIKATSGNTESGVDLNYRFEN